MNSLYIHTEDIHNMTAPREAVPVIMNLLKPESVLDVGCGTGTWLKAFEEAGVSDYMGVDGDYVDRSQLKIPNHTFAARDLRTAWTLNREFDLVVSLEVAEHLPEESADQFVETLVKHANKSIIFSAAIPGQGGQNHLNEQWPEYWNEKFKKHGFYFHDVIRPLIWNNEKIQWWYRQNIFLIKKEKSTSKILNCIHPDCFDFHVKTLEETNHALLVGRYGVVHSFKILLRAIESFIDRKMKV